MSSVAFEPIRLELEGGDVRARLADSGDQIRQPPTNRRDLWEVRSLAGGVATDPATLLLPLMPAADPTLSQAEPEGRSRSADRPLRVVLLNFAHGAEFATPEAVLEEYRSLTGWARGLVSAGAEVTVIQGFSREARLEIDGVEYRFAAGAYAPSLPWWRIPWSALRVLETLDPDVVHLNGLIYAVSARAIRRSLGTGVALVAQHHAEPPFTAISGSIQRWGLGAVDGFFFTGRDMAQPWRDAGRIASKQSVYEILEGSSLFRGADQAAARAATGLEGAPTFFWSGNLDRNKDPLTVLQGFELLREDLPDARLYMAYRHSSLLAEVADRIRSSESLSRSVKLLGSLPYAELEPYLSAADIFLQGSHREGSGYALVDALACGLVPAVTDIASFRFITGGSCGELWAPGDAHQLRAAVLRIMSGSLEAQREAARARFVRSLSFEAIGKQALAAYSELVGRCRAVAG